MKTRTTSRDVALAITGVVPAWLSSFLLALLFLSVWLAPGWLGWHRMDGLNVIVITEIVTMCVMLLILGGKGERFAWLSIVPVAGVAGAFVGVHAGPLLGAGLAIHIVARMAGIWSDLRTARIALNEVGLGLIAMISAWIAVGVLPMPALGWTEAAVPHDLWWDVPTTSDLTPRVPHGLPAWGFLYFSLVAIVDRVHLAERLEWFWNSPDDHGPTPHDLLSKTDKEPNP